MMISDGVLGERFLFWRCLCEFTAIYISYTFYIAGRKAGKQESRKPTVSRNLPFHELIIDGIVSLDQDTLYMYH